MATVSDNNNIQTTSDNGEGPYAYAISILPRVLISVAVPLLLKAGGLSISGGGGGEVSSGKGGASVPSSSSSSLFMKGALITLAANLFVASDFFLSAGQVVGGFLTTAATSHESLLARASRAAAMCLIKAPPIASMGGLMLWAYHSASSSSTSAAAASASSAASKLNVNALTASSSFSQRRFFIGLGIAAVGLDVAITAACFYLTVKERGFKYWATFNFDLPRQQQTPTNSSKNE